MLLAQILALYLPQQRHKMIQYTYNKDKELLSIDFTGTVNFLDINGIWGELDLIINPKVKHLRAIIKMNCCESDLNPAHLQCIIDTQRIKHRQGVFYSIAIVCTKPVNTAMAMVYQNISNLLNMDVRVFSSISSAEKHLLKTKHLINS